VIIIDHNVRTELNWPFT